ncbi:MAG TPA: succinate dehydrogenase iron-sulfur subunit [Candidatus Polarisedimenticolia bacterium]|nr:succinate dehydrogenase iron-sulfur subunit [Candidatus Polarisedimenticolia bacterium]
MPSPAVRVRVRRQDAPDAPPRWEDFSVRREPGMNVIYCLMQIQRSPVTVEGKRTTPVAWEAHCLEEVCGACTMVINGRVRQSCSALVDHLGDTIELTPMTKFPVVRDLIVDRSRMFDDLIKIRGWIPIQGTYDLGPGPRVPPADQEVAYRLSTCMTCGCCLEVCPNVNARSDFIGPAAISLARLYNTHPTGQASAGERLEALMEPGGISECGNAQNCVRACPKGIPLTDSIGAMGRSVTLHAFKKLLGG